MTQAVFENDVIELEAGETLLNGLLRHGHNIPNGCQAGACQSCLMTSNDPVPTAAQVGLTDAQKAMGLFLSCCCKPEQPISVSLATDAMTNITAEVVDITPLNDNVYQLHLKTEADFDYRAGQFVTLFKDEQTARSYSLASEPQYDKDTLTFHIKRLEEGAFSPWITSLNAGDTLELQGPKGLCFYTAETTQPLFLSGIGTGLAPLLGILRDALQQQHQGTITMVLGAKSSDQFYLVEELKSLAEKHENLTVHFLAQELTDNADATIKAGDIYAYTKETIPDMKGYRAFLCGADSFVKKMKRQCFMGGANMQDISADAFLVSG